MIVLKKIGFAKIIGEGWSFPNKVDTVNVVLMGLKMIDNIISKIANLLIFLLLLMPLYGFWFKKDVWTAFVYPDGVMGKVDKDSPFDTKEDCLRWCRGRIATYYIDKENVDYECGKNCKLKNKNLDLYICEETIDE